MPGEKIHQTFVFALCSISLGQCSRSSAAEHKWNDNYIFLYLVLYQAYPLGPMFFCSISSTNPKKTRTHFQVYLYHRHYCSIWRQFNRTLFCDESSELKFDSINWAWIWFDSAKNGLKFHSFFFYINIDCNCQLDK